MAAENSFKQVVNRSVKTTNNSLPVVGGREHSNFGLQGSQHIKPCLKSFNSNKQKQGCTLTEQRDTLTNIQAYKSQYFQSKISCSRILSLAKSCPESHRKSKCASTESLTIMPESSIFGCMISAATSSLAHIQV